MNAADHVVHGIDVSALVTYLRKMETQHDRKQAFHWETRRLSPMSRDEVKKVMFEQWKESAGE